ncbi:MAG TPA: hypothetical protein VFZ68_10900 [Acidimicrobiales bacterium]
MTVTRDIDPDRAGDLLERAPRACLAVAGDHGAQALPVAFAWIDGRYLAGVAANTGRLPDPGDEVVLLVDDGVHFFDLRAVYVRGRAEATTGPADPTDGLTWFEVVPQRTVAWDYGQMREVDDGA